jgi:hypothetical protein
VSAIPLQFSRGDRTPLELFLAGVEKRKSGSKEAKGGDSFDEGDKIDEKALAALIRAVVALNASSAAQRPGTRA